MKLEDEFVPPCYVCGKVWQRKDVEKWCFFSGILACKDHPGVLDWYTGAVKMSEERLKLSFDT
jgi:hypothetical protein